MATALVITTYQKVLLEMVFEDNKLVEAHNISTNDILGNIYSASVTNVIPSIGAAFLDAGLGDTLYYNIADFSGRELYARHGKQNHPCVGDTMLIQVSREAMQKKKASCSSNLSLTGKYLVVNRSNAIGISKSITDSSKRDELKSFAENLDTYLSCKEKFGAGIIFRTSCQLADIESIKEETIKLLCELDSIISRGLHEIPKKCLYSKTDGSASYINYIRNFIAKHRDEVLRVHTDIESVRDGIRSMPELADELFEFHYEKFQELDLIFKVDTQIQKVLQRKIYLKSGGSIVIDQTEALTAIDVNSGQFTKGANAEKHYLKTNMEAAEEIARVLRLRNLSGMILIDFINMKNKESEKTLISHLKTCISKDPVKTIFVDLTGLGLAEMTRQKIEKPLNELFYEKTSGKND